MTSNSAQLNVFLCHASQDKPAVRELYRRLSEEDWIDPWLDEEKLLPGQDWDLEIEKAVEAADVVIVCLSSHSVSKEGYVQRELKFVLDIALDKPEGTIFVIPLRLDECAVPRRLRAWQYVDYFPLEQRKRAHQRLMQSLTARHAQLAAGHPVEQGAAVPPAPESILVDLKDQVRSRSNDTPKYVVGPAQASTPSMADLMGSILPILFFAQLAVVMFGQYDDIAWVLLGTTAIVYAFFLIFKREIIANRWLNSAMILFMVAHSLVIYGESSGWSIADAFKILDGIVALVVVILIFSNFRSPRKSAPYASYFLAAYIALYGIKLLLNLAQLYPDWIQTPMTIIALLGSVFLWQER